MSTTMTPEQWMIEAETGVSSRTIWAVLVGSAKGKQQCDGRHYDTPHDPDDLKRCYKLTVLVPGWRDRLSEVPKVFPKWTPFIREWAKLEAMLDRWEHNLEQYRDLPAENRAAFKFDDGLYEFIQELDHEAMLLDGWVQDGPNSWHRGEGSVCAI